MWYPDRMRVSVVLVRALALSIVLAVSLFLAMSPRLAHAHALGSSFEATSTPYIVDVGYDPDVFVEGYAHRFDFDVRAESDLRILPYDYVWVRITQGKRTLLATGLERQELGPTTLLYSFESAGMYEIHVSYREGSDVMAEASFPIDVQKRDDGFVPPFIPAAAAVIGLLVGAGTALIFGGKLALWTGNREERVPNV